MSGFSPRYYHLIYLPMRLALAITHPIFRVHGKERIPEGAAVICCNHPSAADPIWLIIGTHPKHVFRPMAKKELFDIPIIGTAILNLGAFPVDRSGNDLSAIKTSLRILRDEEKLLIFPEGRRVLEGEESEAHAGAILIAARAGAPIVPAYMTPKRRFWSRIDLVYGEPYHPEFSSRKPTPSEMKSAAQQLMDKIGELGASL